jgi:hypothetical protein
MTIEGQPLNDLRSASTVRSHTKASRVSREVLHTYTGRNFRVNLTWAYPVSDAVQPRLLWPRHTTVYDAISDVTSTGPHTRGTTRAVKARALSSANRNAPSLHFKTVNDHS